MKLKYLVGLALLSASLTTSAQTLGFPVADSAAPEDPGQVRLMGNYTFSDAAYVVGGRVAYQVAEPVRLFADIGAVKPDDADDVFGLQLGGLYSIPVDSYFDMGIRLTWYNISEFETTTNKGEEWGLNVMYMTSGVFDNTNDQLEGYLGLGINYDKTTLTSLGEEPVETKNDSVDPAIVTGLMFHFSELFSMYAEVGYVSDLIFGAGFRIDL